ncbi:hypothetical protein ACFQO9_17245 [Chryseobacterium zhengzhouense]|uniref:Uncharacterized protein n=1 Tax=Chryseobacterium zhengzhouense TaxID=1636086 RepID=A0ABW2M4T1_9FLAO
MKYFTLTQNTNEDIIGKYPQVKDLKINFHEARASQWAKITQWKTNEDVPDLNNFILQTKSKFTDCLSSGFVVENHGLFLSQRCKEIFEKFKINGNFYDAIVWGLDEKRSYDFLWYESGAKSKIDCKKSLFVEYLDAKELYGEVVPIDDFEDYKVKFRKIYMEKEGWSIVPKLLKFKEYFDLTPVFGVGVICNENVKNAIEENKLTGFDIRPLNVEIAFE